MSELGQIHPQRKIACPHCNELIGDDEIEKLVSNYEASGGISCRSCGQSIKLPENVINKLRSSRHLGKNLDITM